MTQITFITNDGRTVTAEDGISLLRIAIRAAAGIPFKCGGGVCGTYQATAVETPSQVQVRVTQTPGRAGQMCPMIVKSQTRTGTLDQPRGTRTVVDASDGRPVWGQ